jgi:tetratricopeptide (TPR) repeat protein
MSAQAREAEAAPQPAVDEQHPWLGLASFTEESRGFFHGREEEVAELGRRVQRKLLTILFGQSGLGKTSILRAGIVPRLRPEGYCPVYVRIDYSPESPTPAEQIKQAIFQATRATGSWTQAGVAAEGESLWEFLHHRDDILRDAAGKTVIPLLIFDQFEEIFTLAQADDAGRARATGFVEDLADLVENRPPKALEARIESDDSITERFDFGRADYRILIALREDYLAHLESLKGAMPSITQNRMRLARMNGQQALAAVTKPGGKLVSQEVAESIVRFIAGGSELRNAEVEPSLLSLICRELNNARIAQGRAEISADLLAGSHDTILAEFYERALADQPAAVRSVIEDQLLTESGFRESLAEERLLKAFAAAGAAPDALATLVNRRLLRIEERLDVRRVELTHDVLCGVVKASRGLRLEREAKEEAERQLAAQKAREEATRRALVRARQIAAGAATLAVVAVVGAIFGYINMNRAREAEAAALETRKLAEGARGEAEKLVVFLLEDFQLELEPIGRLDIVASLSKRALDYYAGLPAALRTPATERNRALAQVRYAISLRNLGKLDEAGKAATAAFATLEELKAKGDASEPTAIGLAMASSANARILSQQNRLPESLKEGGRSFELIGPVASAAGSSVAARRAFGEISVSHGFNLLQDGNFEESARVLEQARAALRSIDGLQLGDLSSAALFVEATAWRMDALLALGRVDETRRNGEEARSVAGLILERQPGHMLALRARGLLLSNLGDLEARQLRFVAAMPYYAAAARDYEAFLKVDSGNTISWNNLMANLQSQGLYAEGAGRPREGLQLLRSAARTARGGVLTAIRARNLAFTWFHVSRLEAELGNPEASKEALSEVARLSEIWVRDVPKDAFPRKLQAAWLPMQESQRLLILGEFASAREKAAAAVRLLEPVQASTEGQKRVLADLLGSAHSALAGAAYGQKDYALAERSARSAVEQRLRFPPANHIAELDVAETRAFHAQTLARLGRLAEAREALAPVLAYYAKLPDAREADWVRFRIAGARLAQALANPAEAQARLAEAAQLIDGLTPEYRRTATVVQARNEIALEQAARR